MEYWLPACSVSGSVLQNCKLSAAKLILNSNLQTLTATKISGSTVFLIKTQLQCFTVVTNMKPTPPQGSRQLQCSTVATNMKPTPPQGSRQLQCFTVVTNMKPSPPQGSRLMPSLGLHVYLWPHVTLNFDLLTPTDKLFMPMPRGSLIVK